MTTKESALLRMVANALKVSAKNSAVVLHSAPISFKAVSANHLLNATSKLIFKIKKRRNVLAKKTIENVIRQSAKDAAQIKTKPFLARRF